MKKSVAFLLWVSCLPVCKLVADEHSIEDWLDLMSDSRLCSVVKNTGKKKFFSSRIRLSLLIPEKMLLGQLVYEPYQVSIPRNEFSLWLSTPYTLDLRTLVACRIPWGYGTKDFTKFIFATLKTIAKIIVDHEEKIKICDLDPRKIRISTIGSTPTITFEPQNRTLDEPFQEIDPFEIAGSPRMAFAYLMFYLIFPQTRKYLDEGTLYLRKNLCMFDGKRQTFVAMIPFGLEDPYHATNNTAFYVPFEACALSLFHGKITMRDIITYLDNWEDFNKYFNAVKNSVVGFTLAKREAAREVFDTIERSIFFDLMENVAEKWIRCSVMLLWLEEGPADTPSDYETNFKTFFHSHFRGFTQAKFMQTVCFLCKMCDPRDRSLNIKIQITPRTVQRLEQLIEHVRTTMHELSKVSEACESSAAKPR